jgi:pyruvoyl-dependent arginine decarboxylase (PvlArgDC)
VTGHAVQLVTAGMVIVTVQARQDTAGPAGQATAAVSLAITLVPAGSGWAVYDAEPVSAGDSGGPDAAP